ncbi:MAG TPA: nuclear transport factor 2 family protein [Acidimicrobiales bacterium]
MGDDNVERDPAVQELLDKQAIRELTARYSRAADRADAELMASVFHPDAVYDPGGGHAMTGETIGAQIVEMLLTMMASSIHQVGGQLIEVRGDTAVGETYTSGQHVLADGQRLRTQTRYLDRFERRDGEWRIANRQVVSEAFEVLPAYDGPTTGVESASRRDRTDPSYALFAG